MASPPGSAGEDQAFKIPVPCARTQDDVLIAAQGGAWGATVQDGHAGVGRRYGDLSGGKCHRCLRGRERHSIRAIRAVADVALIAVGAVVQDDDVARDRLR
jgi:hypothetical protein